MCQRFLNLEREAWEAQRASKGLLPWVKTSLSMGPVSETKVCSHSRQEDQNLNAPTPAPLTSLSWTSLHLLFT